MNSLAFDTHRAVKVLCEAGAAEPLAEAFVETIGDAKTDLETEIVEVRTDLEAKIDEVQTGLRAEIKTEIGESEARVQAKINRL